MRIKIFFTVFLLAWSMGVAFAGPGTVLDDVVLQTSERDCAIIKVCAPDKAVHLSDLPGRFVLVEAFSMYCPFCQASAGDMNKLAALINASPFAKELTLVALGAGNSRFEVDFFRDKYKIPFALFPDQTMEFYECMGEPGTPYLALAEKTDKGLVVLWDHVGPVKDAKAMFAELVRELELSR